MRINSCFSAIKQAAVNFRVMMSSDYYGQTADVISQVLKDVGNYRPACLNEVHLAIVYRTVDPILAIRRGEEIK